MFQGALRLRGPRQDRGLRSRLRLFGANDAGCENRFGSWEVDEFVKAKHDLTEIGEPELSGVFLLGVRGGLGVKEGATFGEFSESRFAGESSKVELANSLVGLASV